MRKKSGYFDCMVLSKMLNIYKNKIFTAELPCLVINI